MDAESRRVRLLELLRELWKEVASARALERTDAVASERVSGKVRALCAEIRAVAGPATVAADGPTATRPNSGPTATQ